MMRVIFVWWVSRPGPYQIFYMFHWIHAMRISWRVSRPLPYFIFYMFHWIYRFNKPLGFCCLFVDWVRWMAVWRIDLTWPASNEF